MEIGDRLRSIMDQTGWTQAELALRLDVSQPTVNRWLAGADPRGSRRDRILALAREVGGESDGQDEESALVPIIGRAGAATDGTIAHASGQGNFGYVPRPRGASPETVAIEIHGGSMGYLTDGSIVLYSERHPQPLPDMLGVDVVVELDDERVLLKRLLRGSEPGLWDLESVVGPRLPDQRIRWFAHVDFIIPPWRAKKLRIED